MSKKWPEVMQSAVLGALKQSAFSHSSIDLIYAFSDNSVVLFSEYFDANVRIPQGQLLPEIIPEELITNFSELNHSDVIMLEN